MVIKLPTSSWITLSKVFPGCCPCVTKRLTPIKTNILQNSKRPLCFQPHIYVSRYKNLNAHAFSTSRSKTVSFCHAETFSLVTGLSSIQSLSRVNSLRPHERSTPGLPVHHHLPEFTQTHNHRVGDATQPSHPLSSPSPPALIFSQHQGLFKWVSSSHQVA